MKLLAVLVLLVTIAGCLMVLPVDATVKPAHPKRQHVKHKPGARVVHAPAAETVRLTRLANARAKAAMLARRYVGVPYVFGGMSPRGFDCSGLVAYVMRLVGIVVPHYTYSQLHAGTPIAPLGPLEAGDVLFFNEGGHEGLYLGGGLYIVAPHSGERVQIRRLDRPVYQAVRFNRG